MSYCLTVFEHVAGCCLVTLYKADDSSKNAGVGKLTLLLVFLVVLSCMVLLAAAGLAVALLLGYWARRR